MNIFKHEIKQNWISTAIWIASIVAVVALYISIYPTIADKPELTKVVEQMPEAFKRAFGVTGDTFSTFPALYAMMLNLAILAGAVQAMNLGVNLVSKEVRDKTADFLLSKPIRRSDVLTQKLLSAVALLVATNVVFLAAAWALIQAVIEDPLKFEVFIRSSLTLILIQSFFFSLGFLFGVALPRIRSVIAVTLPTVFGFYVFGLLDTVVGVKKIKYMTPFKFFDINKLVAGDSFQTSSLIYLGVLVTLAIIASYIIYQKKDIPTV